MDDQDINPTWVAGNGMTILMTENIQAVAIEILFGKGVLPIPVPPSEMAVHPSEFLDDDGQHDYDLINTCPANFPDLWEDERLEWAEGVCSQARTRNLREYDPSLLVQNLLGEESNDHVH